MRKNKIKHIALGCSLICFFSACNRDKYVMSKNEMTDVIYDLQIAQALYQSKNITSQEEKEAMLNGILKKHNITKETLDSSLVWYSDRAEIYNKINDSVITRLRNEQAQIEVEAQAQRQRDNIGFELLPPNILLNSYNKVFAFAFDSTNVATKLNYPSLSLSFSVLGLSQDVSLQTSIHFVYNDTTIVSEQQVTPSSYVLNKPQGNEPLKEIYGYVKASSKSPLFEVLLYNIKLGEPSSVESDLSSAVSNM